MMTPENLNRVIPHDEAVLRLKALGRDYYAEAGLALARGARSNPVWTERQLREAEIQGETRELIQKVALVEGDQSEEAEKLQHA